MYSGRSLPTFQRFRLYGATTQKTTSCYTGVAVKRYLSVDNTPWAVCHIIAWKLEVHTPQHIISGKSLEINCRRPGKIINYAFIFCDLQEISQNINRQTTEKPHDSQNLVIFNTAFGCDRCKYSLLLCIICVSLSDICIHISRKALIRKLQFITQQLQSSIRLNSWYCQPQ
jgi:hypothetical protein